MIGATTIGVRQSDSRPTTLPTDTKRTDREILFLGGRKWLNELCKLQDVNCWVDGRGDQGIEEGQNTEGGRFVLSTEDDDEEEGEE